jgi:hypothetical protein
MPPPPRMTAKVSPLKGMAVDEFVAKKLTAAQAKIVNSLRRIIRQAAPTATESLKWGQPVYEENGPFAYIKPSKNHITFGFWRGAELSDPRGVLEGEGDRMKHVKLASMKDIRKPVLQKFIKEALRLNREKGDPTKRKAV